MDINVLNAINAIFVHDFGHKRSFIHLEKMKEVRFLCNYKRQLYIKFAIIFCILKHFLSRKKYVFIFKIYSNQKLSYLQRYFSLFWKLFDDNSILYRWVLEKCCVEIYCKFLNKNFLVIRRFVIFRSDAPNRRICILWMDLIRMQRACLFLSDCLIPCWTYV